MIIALDPNKAFIVYFTRILKGLEGLEEEESRSKFLWPTKNLLTETLTTIFYDFQELQMVE